MGQNKKALLILDIQNDFTADNARMPVDKRQQNSMIVNINKLIDDSIKKELIIVYVYNEYSKFDLLNIFRNFAAIKKTEGAKFDKRLHVVNKNCFSKNGGNAFSNPRLGDFLKSMNVEQIYICGLYAEACVYRTLKGAIENKYSVIVLTDCIASRSDNTLLKTIEKYVELGVPMILSDHL